MRGEVMLDPPFGDEAKRLVKEEFGGIMELLAVIPSYVEMDVVLRRISWVESGEIPRDVLEMGDVQDLLTFYALIGGRSHSHPTASRWSS